MHQGCISELYPQALILTEDRGDSEKIRLTQGKKLKGPALERGHQHP